MIIFENTNYKIQSFISGMLSNNSYLITSKASDKNIIIDIPYIPRDLFSKIPRDPMNKSNNIKNTIGIITHGHFDHIEGIDFIKDRYGEIEIFMGFEDSKYLDYSGKITKLRVFILVFLVDQFLTMDIFLIYFFQMKEFFFCTLE